MEFDGFYSGLGRRDRESCGAGVDPRMDLQRAGNLKRPEAKGIRCEQCLRERFISPGRLSVYASALRDASAAADHRSRLRGDATLAPLPLVR